MSTASCSMLLIADLSPDQSNPRESLNYDAVEQYAADIEAGSAFPPIIVFGNGAGRWIADGFHRLEAHRRLGRQAIAADVRSGTRRDAILYSVGANAKHGLRRTNADKRRAVELLLNDEEWARKSDHWIAEKCGVSHAFVGKMRPALETVSSQRESRDGRTINTANIGKATAAAPRPAQSAPAIAVVRTAPAVEYIADGQDKEAADVEPTPAPTKREVEPTQQSHQREEPRERLAPVVAPMAATARPADDLAPLKDLFLSYPIERQIAFLEWANSEAS